MMWLHIFQFLPPPIGPCQVLGGQPAVAMFFTWTAPCVFLLRLCILTQGQPFVTSLSEGKQMIRSPLIVRPQISSWLEVEHGRRVAVCSAVGGKPVASISWSTMGNFRGNQSSILNPDSTFTVDSRLALPENVSSDNLNCIVTHPCLGEAHIEKVSPSALKEGLAPVIAAQYSVLSIGTVILLCGILTSCCIIKKSVGKWSQRTRFFYIPQISRTQQSHLSSY
ncbi:uncharacterized protein LOC108933057 isoform X3 [Scleropages formosus]|uniref:uncharacterized protein LOC108933057 isoform X3 n=1 Tax=Scleropages formosus TaxID=113540 RepID=UPI00087914EE|nr:uncharacterized protein LOC108933057 isoform X3 [Scleropages formosus]